MRRRSERGGRRSTRYLSGFRRPVTQAVRAAAGTRSATARAAASTSARVTSRCVTARTRRGAHRAHADAPLGQRGDQRRRVVDLEEHEVRLGLGDVHHPAQRLEQGAGVRVVLGQPLDVVVERVQAGGGEDAGLAHRAAPHLLVAPGAADQLLRPGEDRADRRAEALGEVEPRAVEAGRPSRPPARRWPRPRSAAARRRGARAGRARGRPRAPPAPARAARRSRPPCSSSAPRTRARCAAGSGRRGGGSAPRPARR